MQQTSRVKGVGIVSSDEEIREDEEEEVIEVITHDEEDEDEDDLDAPSRGVDIIGERPVRKSPAQQPPGCLYSFLLFLVGIGVGFVACMTYYNSSGVQTKDEKAMDMNIMNAKEDLKVMCTEDLAVALELVNERNYGDASVVLGRVAKYYGAMATLQPGVQIPGKAEVDGILELLTKEDATTEDQAEAVKQLNALVNPEEAAAESEAATEGEEGAEGEEAATGEESASDEEAAPAEGDEEAAADTEEATADDEATADGEEASADAEGTTEDDASATADDEGEEEAPADTEEPTEESKTEGEGE